MNYIVDFYKGLDTFNLIIFWGIIIIVVLLLMFSLILIWKNKKLKYILAKKEQELNESNEELAVIKKNEKYKEKKYSNETNKNIEITQTKENIQHLKEKIELNNQISEEKFIAEEHVIEYNTPQSILNTNANNIKEPQTKKIVTQGLDEPKLYKKQEPYQRNILREMSLNQTSPIGIVRQREQIDKTLENANELYDTLQTKEIDIIPIINNNTLTNSNDTEREITKNKSNKEESPIKDSYLSQVSKKLAQYNKNDGLIRTEYELKQEEEAIISYEELMRKKDTIKIIDDEDAVISIEELMKQKKQDEKLYSITDSEENDKFIKELKNFREDL